MENLNKEIKKQLELMLDKMDDGGMDCSYQGINYNSAIKEAVTAIKGLITRTTTMEKTYYCPKCGKEINRDIKNISPGYFAACLNCDEDFYRVELNASPNNITTN